MPTSYREPSVRDDDVILYFDYAKSLENKRRPISWRMLLRPLSGAAVCAAISAVCYAVDELLFGYSLLYLLTAIGMGIGFVAEIRQRRQLSADNIVAARRRAAPEPRKP